MQIMVYQVAQLVKNLPAKTGDARFAVSIPWLGRCPGEGNGNPFTILAWKIPRIEEPRGGGEVHSP